MAAGGIRSRARRGGGLSGHLAQWRESDIAVRGTEAQLVEPQLRMLMEDGRGDIECGLPRERNFGAKVFEQERLCAAADQGRFGAGIGRVGLISGNKTYDFRRSASGRTSSTPTWRRSCG